MSNPSLQSHSQQGQGSKQNKLVRIDTSFFDVLKKTLDEDPEKFVFVTSDQRGFEQYRLMATEPAIEAKEDSQQNYLSQEELDEFSLKVQKLFDKPGLREQLNDPEEETSQSQAQNLDGPFRTQELPPAAEEALSHIREMSSRMAEKLTISTGLLSEAPYIPGNFVIGDDLPSEPVNVSKEEALQPQVDDLSSPNITSEEPKPEPIFLTEKPKPEPFIPIEKPKLEPFTPIEKPKPEPFTPIEKPKLEPLTPIEKPKPEPFTPIEKPKLEPFTPIETKPNDSPKLVVGKTIPSFQNSSKNPPPPPPPGTDKKYSDAHHNELIYQLNRSMKVVDKLLKEADRDLKQQNKYYRRAADLIGKMLDLVSKNEQFRKDIEWLTEAQNRYERELSIYWENLQTLHQFLNTTERRLLVEHNVPGVDTLIEDGYKILQKWRGKISSQKVLDNIKDLRDEAYRLTGASNLNSQKFRGILVKLGVGVGAVVVVVVDVQAQETGVLTPPQAVVSGTLGASVLSAYVEDVMKLTGLRN